MKIYRAVFCFFKIKKIKYVFVDFLAACIFLSFSVSSQSAVSNNLYEDELLYSCLISRKGELSITNSRTVSNLQKKAWRFVREGDYIEAEKIQKVVVELRRRLYGTDSLNAIEATEYLNFIKARTILKADGRESAMLFKIKDYKQKNNAQLEHARSSFVLAEKYYQEDKYKEAVYYYKEVVAALSGHAQVDSSILVKSLFNLGYIYYAMDSIDKSFVVYSKAVDILKEPRENKNKDEIFYSDVRLMLAVVSEIKGRNDLADVSYQLSGLIKTRLLGEDHPDTQNLYELYSSFSKSRKAYDKAERLYKVSLRYLMKKGSVNSPKVANIFESLGDVYRFKGEYELAEDSYLKAIDVREKINDALLVDTIKKLADLYYSQQYSVKSKAAYVKIISLIGRGVTHSLNISDKAEIFFNVADIYYKERDYDKVGGYVEKAVLEYSGLFERGSEHDLEYAINQLSLMLSIDQYDSAEELCQAIISYPMIHINPEKYGDVIYKSLRSAQAKKVELYNIRASIERAESFYRVLSPEKKLTIQKLNIASGLKEIVKSSLALPSR